MKRLGSRKKLYLVTLLVSVAAAAVTAATLNAQCFDYENSRVIIVDGEYYCGSTGPWCMECISSTSGGGVILCIYDPWNGECSDGGGNAGMPSV